MAAVAAIRAIGTGLVMALVAVATNAFAQHLAIGRALFQHQCSRCHGMPPGVARGAEAAIGEPLNILAAPGKVNPMASLRSIVTEQDARDIAAFLADYASPQATLRDDTERLFAWAEWKWQGLLQSRPNTFSVDRYQVRHYAQAGLYIGIADGVVHLYDEGRPDLGIQALGPSVHFLERAASDGF